MADVTCLKGIEIESENDVIFDNILEDYKKQNFENAVKLYVSYIDSTVILTDLYTNMIVNALKAGNKEFEEKYVNKLKNTLLIKSLI